MKTLATLVALASLAFSARAAVIYSSFGAGDQTSDGFFNSGVTWGEEITLGGTNATVNSIAFHVNYSYGSSPSSFTLRLWNVNPGADNIYQTADDTLGSLIYSNSYTGLTVASHSALTLGGLSVSVPQNFAYTIYSPDAPSYTMDFTYDSSASNGGSANPGLFIWDALWTSKPVTTGTSLNVPAPWGNNKYWNPLTEITGTMTLIPEPSAMQLAAACGILAFAFRRLRKARMG